jgi:peptidoglycan/LPS O-acetylase OafA/YrhL
MSTKAPRLHWVDHLRTAMILLVVNMHACVTYSHVGDWYYLIDPAPPAPVKLLFIFWQGHLQAFFMGLLFFLAGYFADRSLSRRGPRAFLAERSWRLGIPTLFYMLAIHPFILLVLNPWNADFPPPFEYYAHYLSTGKFLGCSGPLWFAFALLIFCNLFAGIRLAPGQYIADSTSKPSETPRLPSLLSLVLLGIGLGLATFLMRLVQPIGTSISNFQLCFFPQYIVVFILGIVISRRDALSALATAPAVRRAGRLAILGGPLLLATVGLLGGPIPETGPNPYSGGWHWQAFDLAMWEQVTGVGLGVGALAFFAHYFNRDTPALRWLSDRSFGVYVFHAPILVALTMLFRPVHGSALLMAPLLTAITLGASYLFTDLVRRIPGVRTVL